MGAARSLLAVLVLATCACGTALTPVASKPTAKPTARQVATPSNEPWVAPFEAIDFVDRTHGWEVTLRQAGSVVAVAPTSDAGATWGMPVVVGHFTVDADGNIPSFGVRFANTLDGWVFGQGIFATADGGATWTPAQVTSTVYDLAVTGSSAWALTSGGMLSSEAGSTRWTAVPHAPRQGPGSIQLIRVGSRVAFIAAQAQFSTRLYHTTDAGLTWTSIAVPCNGYSMPVATLDGIHLWMICGSEPSAGEQAKWAYTSADSGAHWTMRAFNDGVKAVGSMPIAGYTKLLVNTSTTTGFMAGNRGDLFRSTDAGQNWIPMHVSVGEGFFAGLQFVDAGTGWVAAQTGDVSLDGRIGLFRTTDGGATWKLVSSMAGTTA